MSFARRKRISAALSYAVLLLAAFLSLFPVFWTITTSIKQRADTFVLPPKFIWFDPTLKNYSAIFHTRGFGQIYLNTILVTLGSTALCVMLSTLAAYALSRTPRFVSRAPLEISLVLVRAIPAIVLMVPLFHITSQLGVYDSRVALIVMYATINMPFATWLMSSFVGQVPVALEQSAAIDGAGQVATFWYVVLPLLLPGIAASTIFVALFTWNEFLIPVMLAGNSAKTLPVFISGFISARNLDWGPMAAASSLAIIPITIVTVVAQRALISGMSSGALKG
ncbi:MULTISPECIES: carbohydrate ABC transporter permease [Mesorhizobium]|uniref:Carbohydrate ABC transporter permease n=1 Tax=Mesorhizobium neociceri TaxID=1307853 RepID=A0A838B8A3_9HYPH|nr:MULTISPECIES: carbohydrate ABC transporter permease [Mesorhizobium]MBA1142317.1 carbohydrate ABC transporter permease [Mesorhizobium neociceri]